MKLNLLLILKRINPFKSPGQIFAIDPTAKTVTFKILAPVELYYTEAVEEGGIQPRVRPVSVATSVVDGTVSLALVDGFYVGKVNIPYGTRIKEIKPDETTFSMKSTSEGFKIDAFVGPSSLVDYVKKGLVEIVGLEY